MYKSIAELWLVPCCFVLHRLQLHVCSVFNCTPSPLSNWFCQYSSKANIGVYLCMFCVDLKSERCSAEIAFCRGTAVFAVALWTPSEPSDRWGESREINFAPGSPSDSSSYSALSRRHILISAWSECQIQCVPPASLRKRQIRLSICMQREWRELGSRERSREMILMMTVWALSWLTQEYIVAQIRFIQTAFACISLFSLNSSFISFVGPFLPVFSSCSPLCPLSPCCLLSRCPFPSERQARLEAVREVFLAAYSSTVGLKSSAPSPSGAISGLLEQFARGVGLRGINAIVWIFSVWLQTLHLLPSILGWLCGLSTIKCQISLRFRG